MTTEADRFPVLHDGLLRDVPGTMRRLDDKHQYRETATVWTLHLRIKPATVEAVQATADRIMATGAECLTGDYIGGDSFAEWCEVYDGQPWYADYGRALHVFYTAPDLGTAQATGAILGTFAGIAEATDACISTGGDWAEQAECFGLVTA